MRGMRWKELDGDPMTATDDGKEKCVYCGGSGDSAGAIGKPCGVCGGTGRASKLSFGYRLNSWTATDGLIRMLRDALTSPHSLPPTRRDLARSADCLKRAVDELAEHGLMQSLHDIERIAAGAAEEEE